MDYYETAENMQNELIDPKEKYRDDYSILNDGWH